MFQPHHFRALPPPYPASCFPENGNAPPDHQVLLSYDVSTTGTVKNIKVISSTDPCFEESAVAAAGHWRFNPRTINGKKVIQKGTETTVTFKYNSVSEVKEYDAQPIYRVPPEYPEGCARRARSEEYVILEFDVSAKGTPENIKIIESTRKCFHKSAIAAVEKWKYDPKTVDGLTVVRPNVITRITYLLKKTGTSRSPRDLRSGFVQKIKSVSRLLNANKLDKAEEKLDDITNKYGDDFSPAERALFHQMRGALRLSRKDYTGALDDLRIAQKGRYLDEKTTIAIGEMIDNLEKALGIRPAVK